MESATFVKMQIYSFFKGHNSFRFYKKYLNFFVVLLNLIFFYFHSLMYIKNLGII